MSDDSQELPYAKDGNCPGSVAFRQGFQQTQGLFMPRQFFPMGIDKDVCIYGIHCLPSMIS